MRLVVLTAGLLVIAGLTTFGYLRTSRKNADVELAAFAKTVPAPLTAEVRQWLRPQLVRRSVYPALGAMWGLIAANIPLTPGWHELPWYWFAGLVGSAVGLTAGVLVAGYRTVPLLDGSVRTVDPVRRRVSDHFDRAHVLRLRLAVVVSGVSLALAVAIATSGSRPTASRALLACVLGVILVAAHYWVAAAVISRPMVTSSPEGLLWQKALLAKTVEPMPTYAFLVAAFSAAIAVFAAVVTSRELPPPVLVLSAGVALVVVASAAAVLVSDRKNVHRAGVVVPGQQATP